LLRYLIPQVGALSLPIMRVSSRAIARLPAVAASIALGSVSLSGYSFGGGSSPSAAPVAAATAAQILSLSNDYPGVTVAHNVTYETADGVALKLDICLPANETGRPLASRPAIVSIHGGSWAFGSPSEPRWLHVCEWIASTRYVTVSVGYQLAPRYRYPDALHDIQHAVEWLRDASQVNRFHIDPSLIGVFGGSAGGNLAALVGTTGSGSTTRGDRVAAVAELSGPSNLTASGEELPDFYPYVLSYLGCRAFSDSPQAVKASPLFKVKRTDPPFFIGQSTDERIPVVQSSALARRLRSVGVQVTFVTVRGHNHSITMLDHELRRRISNFFHAQLVDNHSDGPMR
jgi:acetyl esterase